jgi:ADP-ribose pyrophosphatase
MDITKVEPLALGKWLSLFRVDFRLQGRAERSWSLATRNAAPKCVHGNFADPDVVIIVPFHTGRQQLVLIREFRAALAGDQYGFPAGLVDEGESAVAAARRELQEETGLVLTRVIRQSPPVYSSAGMTDESSALVYVEIIEVVFVSPEKAGRLCADPTLKFDAKAWLIASRFAETGGV